MSPKALYLAVGVLLALPILAASAALVRCNRELAAAGGRRLEGERFGLRLLLIQSLVPPLQFLPLLRSVTETPGQLASSAVVLLPVASLLCGVVSFGFLVRYGHGWGRVLLPALNLLIFTFSAALLIAAGATA